MASFSDELKEATKALQGFVGALRSGGAAGGSGGASGRDSRPSSAGVPSGTSISPAIMGAASSAASLLTPAANAYAISGSSEGLSEAVSASALHALRDFSPAGIPIGGLLGAATGLSGALDTTGRAGAATADITTDLARIGINVSDQQRRGMFRASLAQEKNVQREQEKVAGLTGSADSLEAAKPAGAGVGFDAVVSVLRSIEALMRDLRGGAR